MCVCVYVRVCIIKQLAKYIPLTIITTGGIVRGMLLKHERESVCNDRLHYNGRLHTHDYYHAYVAQMNAGLVLNYIQT